MVAHELAGRDLGHAEAAEVEDQVAVVAEEKVANFVAHLAAVVVVAVVQPESHVEVARGDENGLDAAVEQNLELVLGRRDPDDLAALACYCW